MSDIAAPSNPAEVSPDALLTRLVQEHLNRAGVSAATANADAAASTEAPAEPSLVIDQQAVDAAIAQAQVGAPAEPFKPQESAPAISIPAEPFKPTQGPAAISVPAAPFQAAESAAGISIPAAPFQATQDAPAISVPAEPFKPAEVAAAVVLPGEPFKEPSPLRGSATLNAAELDALLSDEGQSLVEQEQETLSASPAPTPVADVQPHIDQAEGVMAEELAQLIDTPRPKADGMDGKPVTAACVPERPLQAAPQIAPAVVAAPAAQGAPVPKPVAQTVPTPVAAVSEKAVASQAVPVPEKTPEKTPEKAAPAAAHPADAASAASAPPAAGQRSRSWPATILRDTLLMVAQICDLPFTRLSEEIKQLIAFAGLVLLASGGVLLIVGCLHR